MQFGPWHPLAQAADLAPATPGVLQTRGEALVVLPRGKSAMILYAASGDGESLQDFVRGNGAVLLASAAEHGACYIRFASSARPDRELQRLLGQFRERFGGPPPANS